MKMLWKISLVTPPAQKYDFTYSQQYRALLSLWCSEAYSKETEPRTVSDVSTVQPCKLLLYYREKANDSFCVIPLIEYSFETTLKRSGIG